MLNKIIQHTLLLLCLCLTMFINAQSLNITDESLVHDDINRNAIKVVIAPASKEIKKEFKDYMKNHHDTKVKGIGFLTNKDVLYTERKPIPAISFQELQLFARVIEKNENTEVYIFGQFDNDKQISSANHYVAYENMKALMMDFLKATLPDYYEDIVEDQSDAVADLEDNLEDMQKQLRKNKEKIESLTKENQALEKKLAAREVELKQTKNDLGEKKATLKKVNQTLEKEK